MRTPSPLPVDASDALVLRAWSDDATMGAVARRAQIVLLSGAGLGPTDVADRLGCSKQTVITWRERYRTGGLDGLRDAPRSGRPATVDAEAVVRHTLSPPATDRWTTRSLAACLGISNVAVANIWREWGIVPLAGGGVRLLTEPVLDRPAPEGPPPVPPLRLLDPPLRLLALTGARPARAPETLATFLELLDAGPPPVLVAEAPPQALEHWAERRGAPLHVVPPGRSWPRLARVVDLLADVSGN